MFPSPHHRIHCLLEAADAHPGLAAGFTPAGLLSSSEQAVCQAFRVPKRRRDWLLGRWTAKHLVQAYLLERQGETVALDRIEILADDDGAPYAQVAERLALSLSISHSGRQSFCAVCALDVGSVGADIEQVESRDPSFVRSYLTPAENNVVSDSSPHHRDALITALWSGKEAVLKALRLGLRADTRQVEIDVPALAAHWTLVTAKIDPLLFPSAPSTVLAWNQVQPTYVLSLALLR